MSIQDMQPTTVSKDHLVQKFQQETKLLKVNKTKSKPQEILETLLERIKTILKEGFQLSQKTKDFLTLNLNSMNRIWEET
jgi:RIO-like serine/threonine protein kinase